MKPLTDAPNGIAVVDARMMTPARKQRAANTATLTGICVRIGRALLRQSNSAETVAGKKRRRHATAAVTAENRSPPGYARGPPSPPLDTIAHSSNATYATVQIAHAPAIVAIEATEWRIASDAIVAANLVARPLDMSFTRTAHSGG